MRVALVLAALAALPALPPREAEDRSRRCDPGDGRWRRVCRARACGACPGRIRGRRASDAGVLVVRGASSRAPGSGARCAATSSRSRPASSSRGSSSRPRRARHPRPPPQLEADRPCLLPPGLVGPRATSASRSPRRGATDRLCAPYLTNGIDSCANGGRAVLNLDALAQGASAYRHVERYRRYLVDHEVGHLLGHGHRSCTAICAPAP